MEFSVAEAFDREAIIAGAAIEGLRLFAVQKNESNVELDDLVDIQTSTIAGGEEHTWVRSSPTAVCGAEYAGLNGYDPPRNTSACETNFYTRIRLSSICAAFSGCCMRVP